MSITSKVETQYMDRKHSRSVKNIIQNNYKGSILKNVALETKYKI